TQLQLLHIHHHPLPPTRGTSDQAVTPACAPHPGTPPPHPRLFPSRAVPLAVVCPACHPVSLGRPHDAAIRTKARAGPPRANPRCPTHHIHVSILPRAPATVPCHPESRRPPRGLATPTDLPRPWRGRKHEPPGRPTIR